MASPTQHRQERQPEQKQNGKQEETKAPVAARAELDAREREQNAGKDRQEGLEKRASEQEKLQKAQLAAGQGASSSFMESGPAAQRAKNRDAKPQDGRVDNMTRLHDGQPLAGHFVTIDYGAVDEAVKMVEGVVGEGNAGPGSADYGIFLHAGDVDDDGYPETAVVLLRDEHAAQVVVPYKALRPAAPGGRR